MKPEDIEKLRHKNRMKEIEAEEQAKINVAKVKFDYDCQMQRIRSAEIRKTQHRKDFRESYPK